MSKILACIDGSSYTESVRDHAIWAAQRLGAPLEFLHVLERHPETAAVHDYSGNIGLDAQDSLLSELANLDEARGKLALRRGRALLEHAVIQAKDRGVEQAESRLRHGALVDTLTDLENGVRLLVIGKRGEHANFATMHLGRELERAARALHRPVLVASRSFKPIQRILFAFDGSDTTRKGIEKIAGSPLLKDLACHLVMAGNETPAAREQLQWAHDTLTGAGFAVDSRLAPGAADSVIHQYVTSNAIDLLVMGAYGHSRIRQLIIGSTTTAMVRTCLIPVLLLR
jgi:nucleotide-binding universal stress UspA family protein